MAVDELKALISCWAIKIENEWNDDEVLAEAQEAIELIDNLHRQANDPIVIVE
jgi:hypothetical protein